MLRNHDIAVARFAEQTRQALQILKSMNSCASASLRSATDETTHSLQLVL